MVDIARPYADRLCCLCESAVETPYFCQCDNLGVILIRRRVWDQGYPGLEAECTSLPLVRSFQRLPEEPAVTPLLAKLCVKITERFGQISIRVPEL
jgi:hypothetical protein